MPGSLLIGTHKVPRAGFDCLLKPVSCYMEQGKRIIVNLRTCPGPPSLRDRMTADELSDQRRARTAAPDPGAADSTSLGLPVYSFAAYRSDPPVEFDAGYLVDRRGLVFGHAAAAGSDPRLVADRLPAVVGADGIVAAPPRGPPRVHPSGSGRDGERERLDPVGTLYRNGAGGRLGPGPPLGRARAPVGDAPRTEPVRQSRRAHPPDRARSPTVGCLVRKAAEIRETGDGDHVLILP